MGQNVTGHVTHIAQMNWGILRADWDDPSVAEFVENLDRVNRIAMRSPGFVWMMPEEEMDAAQNDAEGVFGGNPRTASTLSVWETPQALDHFVQHGSCQFYGAVRRVAGAAEDASIRDLADSGRTPSDAERGQSPIRRT